MDPVDDEILTSLLIIVIISFLIKRRRSLRRWWVRPTLLMRDRCGQFETHFRHVKENDHELFYEYTRMAPEQYDFLFALVHRRLRKRSIRKSISPEMRLCITLFFLATGATFKTISWNFLIGRSTASNIIRETCQCLWDVLSPIYMKSPNTDDWKIISKHFYEKWNLPNCIGAVDGKHITIKFPNSSGTKFYNYKRTFSINLMAVADANYNFTMVDVGAYGSQSDGGIFKKSKMGQRFDSSSMHVPQDHVLVNTVIPFPYYLAGDEAFPLKKYIMRPYPGLNLNLLQRIFNYRLSRGRRIIENAFGILCNRWRVLWGAMDVSELTAESVVCAAVVIHNFINKTTEIDVNRILLNFQNNYADSYDEEGNFIPGSWRNNAPNNINDQMELNEGNTRPELLQLRDILANYFMSPAGQVPWQYEKATRGT